MTLRFRDLAIAATAIVDSGSARNFILGKLAKTHNLRRTRTSKPYSIYAVTGEMINQGYVTSQIAPVTLSVENTHHEPFTPFILTNRQAEIILGRPWLIQHQPSKDWATGKILSWGCDCPKLSHLHPPSGKTDSMVINSTSIESPKKICLPVSPHAMPKRP